MSSIDFQEKMLLSSGDEEEGETDDDNDDEVGCASFEGAERDTATVIKMSAHELRECIEYILSPLSPLPTSSSFLSPGC